MAKPTPQLAELTRVAKLARDAIAKRDGLALEAFEAGATWQELAPALGVTKARVYQVLQAQRTAREHTKVHP